MRAASAAADLVWRTHDPDLDKAVRPFLDAATPVHNSRYRCASLRARLAARCRMARGRSQCALQRHRAVAKPLGAARSRGLDAEFLSEQFGRLGNTPYELDAIELEIAGTPLRPVPC